jgi:hypothetical protein
LWAKAVQKLVDAVSESLDLVVMSDDTRGQCVDNAALFVEGADDAGDLPVVRFNRTCEAGDSPVVRFGGA